MGKWFPKLYDPIMKPMESLGFGHIRKTLVQEERGHVLEIGSGTGFNFPYYEKADQVIAIEPDPFMRKKSISRAKHAHVPIEVIPAKCEKIPFSDDHFDSVVGTLVLCTIPESDQALKEIRRVCKQEGRVLFFEHVRLDHAVLGRFQDWMTPVWKRLCDGCHLNRNTLQRIEQTGFQVKRVKKYYKDIFLVIEALNRK